MNKHPFFNPSPLYKEFMLLDVIEKNHSITQRDMSSFINVSVSMINEYLDRYEKENYIKREYKSTKIVDYEITPKGKERRKLLNLWFLRNSHHIYLSAKENILAFLNQNLEHNEKILLYGAGEMADIFLDVIASSPSLTIQIVGIIDDDVIKQGKKFNDIAVLPYKMIQTIEHSSILISSYNHYQAILDKLKNDKTIKSKIIRFF